MTHLDWLLGTGTKGKCQDCGWNNDSAVAMCCGCIGGDSKVQDKLLELARARKKELGI